MQANKILSNEQVSLLINSYQRPRHRTAVSILADTGVRVSELISLRWQDVNFQRSEITITTLKKRQGKEKKRVLPISQRTLTFLIELFEKSKKKKPEDFIFPGSGKTGHWTRVSVNRILTKGARANPELPEHIHPHMLRHTFASRINAKGGTAHDIRNALGHERLETSAIYTHSETEALRKFIDSPLPKQSLWQRWFSAKPKKLRIPLKAHPQTHTLIGRKDELREAQRMVERNISIVITGPVGAGKNALLDAIHFPKKVLLMDDTRGFKKAILDAILLLFDGDKKAAATAMFPHQSRQEIINKLNRENLQNLCLMLAKITAKHEYILRINDFDGLTPTVAKALERLKEHFVVATTSRGIALKHYAAVSDFHQIDLRNLGRPDALRMFHLLTHDLDFSDYEQTKNLIWNTSEGNPRIIAELAERFRKEGEVMEPADVEAICNNHIGKHANEFDASLIFLVLFGGALVWWVYSNSVTFMDRRLVSAMIALVLLFGRYFIRLGKRKSV